MLSKVTLPDLEKYEPRKIVHPVRAGVEYWEDWAEAAARPKEDLEGFPTSNWACFNEFFGGARRELVVLTGDSGAGKTSWALSWFKDTLDQGRAAMVIPMEMGPLDTIDQLSEMVLGKKKWQTTDDDRRRFAEVLKRWKLYVVDHKGMIPQALVENAILYGLHEKGIQFFLIDHLEYIEKSFGHRNESYVIDDCVRRLSGLTREATILLIVHPAKRERADRNKEIDSEELKGTSGLKQTGASVLVHYRPDLSKDETYIRLAKIRSRAHAKNRMKKIRFGYDNRFSVYREAQND